ncbi:MAG: transposase [Alphaproteobacteria bacterium]|jgi:hypothetical protein|nr:transposase [Alphaproteobacteria bacterium]
MMEEMQAQGVEWGADYRQSAASALKDVLEGRMAASIDRHLQEMAGRGEADRRNGSYCRWLMTELGEIELRVPRSRRFSALPVVRAYTRRAEHIDRMILACFVLGLSTRKPATPLVASPTAGSRPAPRPSVACATTSTSCSPASDTELPSNARPCAPPMPSNADSAKSAAGQGPWAPSRAEPKWTKSCSPSSLTKTQPRECLPSSP